MVFIRKKGNEEMAKLYTEEGWINWDYIINANCAFNTIVGARGTGKTYGLFKWLIEHKEKFIYLRRLKTQLDECKRSEGNPFKKIDIDWDLDIKPYPLSGGVIFKSGGKNGDVVAMGQALSVVANIRGIDFSDYNYIVFDEFISSEGEREIKNEFSAFLNFYETVNRNRELQGKKAVQCFMLGNANKLANPYFVGWRMLKTAIKMINKKQSIYKAYDGTRQHIFIIDSPISERKKDTVLYSNSDKDFLDMAINNVFRIDNTKIKSEKLIEYKHIVSIGEIGIYKHKTKKQYYVSATIDKTIYYEPYGIMLKMFQRDYFILRAYYMTHKNIIFESFEIEVIFREMIGIK